MSHIYEQHKAAFARVEAYSIAKDGDRGAGWDRCLRDAGFDVWQAV